MQLLGIGGRRHGQPAQWTRYIAQQPGPVQWTGNIAQQTSPAQ